MNKEYRREDSVARVNSGPKYVDIDRMLASHRDRYPPAHDPPNTLLLAYGDRRYKKMARQLIDSEDELKSKILRELVQDLVTSNKIVVAAMSMDMTEILDRCYDWHYETVLEMSPVKQENIIEVLVGHLDYETDEIRELASQAVVF